MVFEQKRNQKTLTRNVFFFTETKQGSIIDFKHPIQSLIFLILRNPEAEVVGLPGRILDQTVNFKFYGFRIFNATVEIFEIL